MNIKYRSFGALYATNIIVIITLILVQAIVRTIFVIKVDYQEGQKIIVEMQKYYEYFDILNFITVAIFAILIISSFAYLIKVNRNNERRLKQLSKVFSNRGLNPIEEVGSEFTAEDKIIINLWNESIQEIKSQTDMRDEYFKQMVHDLNTPIQILKMNSEMNRMLFESEYAYAIEDEIEELESRITNFLMIEKISYFEKPQTQLIDMEQYCFEIKNRYNVLKSELYVELQNSEIYYRTDRRMLDKIFQNLIENAIKYGVDKKIYIVISDDQIRIKNRVDSYVDAENIFALNTRRYSANGNGLGAKIVKTYAGLLGFEVYSSIENGYFIATLNKIKMNEVKK